jgi:hypothetical protein
MTPRIRQRASITIADKRRDHACDYFEERLAEVVRHGAYFRITIASLSLYIAYSPTATQLYD